MPPRTRKKSSKRRTSAKKTARSLSRWRTAALLFALSSGVLLYLLLFPPKLPERRSLKPLIEASLFRAGLGREYAVITENRAEIRLPSRVSKERVLREIARGIREHYPEALLVRRGKKAEIQERGEVIYSLIFHPPPLKKKKAKPRCRVAIVVDDLGGDWGVAREVMGISRSLTLAILPYERYSRKIAEEAHRRGFEILLHLPMEPKGYPLKDPGKGALFVSMDEDELRRRIAEALEALPHIKGVNNHMGSRFMEHERKVFVVMDELRSRGLFFLDSLTTPKSRGYVVAKKMGLKAAQRDVFLDNLQSEEEFRKQWASFMRRVHRYGKAIAICHPYPSTLRGLKEAVQGMGGEVEVVPLSKVLD
ncbi:MAG: hypothetical protein DRG32_01490 [Deltaproteobacteria bacterium]|nr:MAG: hypothetical protein DRG32_01490 [Deltaproteobacteria bacterium]